MKVNYTKKGYTLSEIDSNQLEQAIYLLGNIKSRCFRDGPNENGEYYSGDGFCAVMDTKKDLDDFHSFVDGFWEAINKRTNIKK